MTDNKDLKKPNELDLELENNQRALNRDISKIKPVNSYYNEKEEITDIKPDEGFDYKEKYIPSDESCEDDASGTKLNPSLEKMTMPDPDDKKTINHLSKMNKRNRNQPL